MKIPLIKADTRWFIKKSRDHVMTILDANPHLFNLDADLDDFLEVIDVEEFRSQYELISAMEKL